MKKGLIVIIVILAIVLIGGCQSCNTYNGLVEKEQIVENKWADVENQYQRRSDLIPNLVRTVKGAADFEKSTLTDVINARASATQVKVDPKDLTPDQIQKFQAAQGQLSQALGRLMMVSERYPDLKATQNFSDLQTQLEGTENRITVARKNFNEAVKNYNISVKRFPANIFAGMFGFKEKGMFQAEKGAEKAPEVSF